LGNKKGKCEWDVFLPILKIKMRFRGLDNISKLALLHKFKYLLHFASKQFHFLKKFKTKSTAPA